MIQCKPAPATQCATLRPWRLSKPAPTPLLPQSLRPPPARRRRRRPHLVVDGRVVGERVQHVARQEARCQVLQGPLGLEAAELPRREAGRVGVGRMRRRGARQLGPAQRREGPLARRAHDVSGGRLLECSPVPSASPAACAPGQGGGGAYLEKGATHTGPHRHDERLDLDWELCAAGQLDGVAGNVAGGRRELALRVAADARCAASGASGHGRGARGGGPSISNKWARRRRQSVKFLGRGGGRACACKARAGWGLLCPPAERGCNVCNQGPAPEPAGG
jgi:hypothetical protein